MRPVSIIIPVLNEEEIIEESVKKLVKYLSSIDTEFEILICDNGSTDRTVEIGKKLEKKYSGKLKIFSIEDKGAVGSAFKKNVKEAKYDNLVSIDMDLSTDLDFIENSLKLFENYDIIIGSKQDTQERSFWRVAMSSVFIGLSQFFLNLPYHDYSMASKAFKRELVLRYLDKIDRGSSYVYKIIFLANRDGFKITEIPVTCEDKRSSKFNIIHEAIYRFNTLMALFIKERVFHNIKT